MDSVSMAGRGYSTRTGALFTVRSANSLSYSLDQRPLGNSGYQQKGNQEIKDPSGTRAEPMFKYYSQTFSDMKGQRFEREKLLFKLNQSSTQDKNAGFMWDQARNSERRGRTEWRTSILSNRSKSLDWRTEARSPDRSFRADSWRRTGDLVGVEGNRVKSTIQAYNNVRSTNSRPSTQSLSSRLRSASLGPKGGQSIFQRIEKLYGSSDFGNAGDYKTTEPPQTLYKDCFGGTFPRRFSSGEHRPSSQSRDTPSWTTSKDASVANSQATTRTRPTQQWKSQTNGWQFEGTHFQNTGLSDIGTRSLDRARSRSSIAARIRAARAEEMNGSGQTDTLLKDISEVSSSTDNPGANRDLDRRNWNRTTLRERNPVRTEGLKDHEEEKPKHSQVWVKRESPTSDEVFMRSDKLKSTEKKSIIAKHPAPATASVRNKINQFEALTKRAQASSPRRAFSVPEHVSRMSQGVQRSSSAKAIGTATNTRVPEFLSEREKKHCPDETKETEIRQRSISEDVPETRPEQEIQYTQSSEELNGDAELKTTLELPLIKDPQPTNTAIDETDFSRIASSEEDFNASSSSGISTPSSDNDKTPTNTPDRSPLLSPSAPPQKTPPFAPVDKPSKQPPPDLTTGLPDLVSRENLSGKRPALDLNAWLDGLNPQITPWDKDGEDDDDSTQRDEDSNYDSDSGESSVTVTSVMSNKNFSVSLADLCNFTGADYDSENDSDEWQSSGRRSVSLSSDVSGFSYVSVLPTEELDKLMEDVKSIGDSNLQDFEDVHVVVLHKDIGVGLGFSLAGGVDQNKPVTVHKVFHSGVAAQEGSTKEGDQVLSINGTALGGVAHWEALRVLRRAKGREMGVVVLKKPDARAVPAGKALASNPALVPVQASERSQCVSLSLEKSDQYLGFSLEGGVGSSLGNKPLSVQKVFQGGPVDKVLPGDEVLEVGGVSVVGMRRLEAWTLIRKLPPGPVNVVLRRQAPAVAT